MADARRVGRRDRAGRFRAQRARPGARGRAHRGRRRCATITATGGPFRTWPRERIAAATPAAGGRASGLVDGLQDQHRLRDPDEQGPRTDRGASPVRARRATGSTCSCIREAIVHGLVQWSDGALTAGLAPPDMRIPIANALRHRRRLAMRLPRLDLAAISRLSFETADEARFPCLALARAALRAGGAMPTILNAANEIAGRSVHGRPDRLLRRIGDVVEAVCSRLAGQAAPARPPPSKKRSRSTQEADRWRGPHVPAERSGSGALKRAPGRGWHGSCQYDRRSDGLVSVRPCSSFLVVLTVVVFVHEFGHFWVGRRCGVGVTAFSIGFGPELFGWTDRHGTRWKISAIPLGGYVKFVGDVNAASVPGQRERSTGCRRRSGPSASRTRASPKRAAIVAAGPIANFLLAIVIFAGLNYVNGRQVVEPRIESVQAGSAAERAGFQPERPRSCRSTGSESTASPTCSAGQRQRRGGTSTIVVDRSGQHVTLRPSRT